MASAALQATCRLFKAALAEPGCACPTELRGSGQERQLEQLESAAVALGFVQTCRWGPRSAREGRAPSPHTCYTRPCQMPFYVCSELQSLAALLPPLGRGMLASCNQSLSAKAISGLLVQQGRALSLLELLLPLAFSAAGTGASGQQLERIRSTLLEGAAAMLAAGAPLVRGGLAQPQPFFGELSFGAGSGMLGFVGRTCEALAQLQPASAQQRALARFEAAVLKPSMMLGLLGQAVVALVCSCTVGGLPWTGCAAFDGSACVCDLHSWRA